MSARDNIITFDKEGKLVIHNGIAYSYVAGGATGYILDSLKWYTGDNYTKYVAMLYSNGIEAWKIVALLSIRSAVKESYVKHHEDLGPLVKDGKLQLNAAEVLEDADLDALMQPTKLALGDWGVAAAKEGEVPVYAKVSDAVKKQITGPDMDQWSVMCARMAYTVIAINGFGLITAAHHYRGQAVSAGENTLKMYSADKAIKAVGTTVTSAAEFLFHDVLHPLNYENVVTLVNAPPHPFISKVAATVTKRLPAVPGGAVFVQRGITARMGVFANSHYVQVVAELKDSPVDHELDTVYGKILANPLDFNAQFRPGKVTESHKLLESVLPYVIALFAMYDAAYPPKRDAQNAGPTGGAGMQKLINEHIGAYASAKEASLEMIAKTEKQNPMEFFFALTGRSMATPPPDVHATS